MLDDVIAMAAGREEPDLLLANARVLNWRKSWRRGGRRKLSFLALPVIPEVRLTDGGLVDVNRSSFVSLCVE